MSSRGWLAVALTAAVAAVAYYVWSTSGDSDQEPVPDAVDAGSDAAEPEVQWLGGAGYRVHAVDSSAGTILRLILRAADQNDRLCIIGQPGAARPLSSARCRELPVGFDATFAAAGDSMPAALMSPSGGLFDEQPRPLTTGDVAAAYVASPRDLFLVIGTDEPKLVSSGGEQPAEVALSSEDWHLIGEHAVIRERSETSDRISVRSVAAEPVVLGELPPHTEVIRSCVAPDVTVVAVNTRLIHGERQVHLFSNAGQDWLGPAVADARTVEYRLSCRPGRTALTWLEADGANGATIRTVHQAACTEEECTHTQSVAQLPGTDPMVAELGDRILMVWASDDGTRARLAPLTEIDGGVSLGQLHASELRVMARRLFVRRGAALVTIRTADGVFAVRIGQGGSGDFLPAGPY